MNHEVEATAAVSATAEAEYLRESAPPVGHTVTLGIAGAVVDAQRLRAGVTTALGQLGNRTTNQTPGSDDEGFFEPDEPLEKIRGAFETGQKGRTGPRVRIRCDGPTATTRVELDGSPLANVAHIGIQAHAADDWPTVSLRLVDVAFDVHAHLADLAVDGYLPRGQAQRVRDMLTAALEETDPGEGHVLLPDVAAPADIAIHPTPPVEQDPDADELAEADLTENAIDQMIRAGVAVRLQDCPACGAVLVPLPLANPDRTVR